MEDLLLLEFSKLFFYARYNLDTVYLKCTLKKTFKLHLRHIGSVHQTNSRPESCEAAVDKLGPASHH